MCILCKTSEVYSLLHRYCKDKFYATINTSHSIEYTHLTIIHKKIPRIPKSISYYSVYFNECVTTTFYFHLMCMCSNILHKIPSHARHIRLHPCTNLYMKILPQTHIHKLLPDTHHTPLHFYILVLSYI